MTTKIFNKDDQESNVAPLLGSPISNVYALNLKEQTPMESSTLQIQSNPFSKF